MQNISLYCFRFLSYFFIFLVLITVLRDEAASQTASRLKSTCSVQYSEFSNCGTGELFRPHCPAGSAQTCPAQLRDFCQSHNSYGNAYYDFFALLSSKFQIGNFTPEQRDRLEDLSTTLKTANDKLATLNRAFSALAEISHINALTTAQSTKEAMEKGPTKVTLAAYFKALQDALIAVEELAAVDSKNRLETVVPKLIAETEKLYYSADSKRKSLYSVMRAKPLSFFWQTGIDAEVKSKRNAFLAAQEMVKEREGLALKKGAVLCKSNDTQVSQRVKGAIVVRKALVKSKKSSKSCDVLSQFWTQCGLVPGEKQVCTKAGSIVACAPADKGQVVHKHVVFADDPQKHCLVQLNLSHCDTEITSQTDLEVDGAYTCGAQSVRRPLTKVLGPLNTVFASCSRSHD